MKRNQVKIPLVFASIDGRFKPGVAEVIGKQPKHPPYINIKDADDRLVVSLDAKEINALIKKWKAANP